MFNGKDHIQFLVMWQCWIVFDMLDATFVQRLGKSNIVVKATFVFSDGISKAENSWFEMARAEGERQIKNQSVATVAATYSVNPPPTAEALWYRLLWESAFPGMAAASAAAEVAPAMWMPRFVKGATDPSARTLTLYVKS